MRDFFVLIINQVFGFHAAHIHGFGLFGEFLLNLMFNVFHPLSEAVSSISQKNLVSIQFSLPFLRLFRLFNLVSELDSRLSSFMDCLKLVKQSILQSRYMVQFGELLSAVFLEFADFAFLVYVEFC